MIFDTISAISTPPGEGGIGIIRISGDEAFSITKKIFVKKNKGGNFKSHYLYYGNIKDPKSDEVVDEVLVAFMKSPNTYTREDIVEINCHGGIIPLQKVLNLTVRYGSRIAEAGEFTKRAFINGRLDLSQAESIINLIRAKTENALSIAVGQLGGNLSKEIKSMRMDLLTVIAHIEANIDFPEDDIEDISDQEIKNTLNKVQIKIEKLIKQGKDGKILQEGIETAIIGRPNAGKSSLLNYLLKEQRAIVTDIPGTTRDIIEEYINFGGVPLKIIDTAGIRETEDKVEKIGVEKTREIIKKSDLVLYIIDNSLGITNEDEEIIGLLKDKKVLVIINKIDIDNELDLKIIEERLSKPVVNKISITENIGLMEIEKSVKKFFFAGEVEVKNNIYLANLRQEESLTKTSRYLEEALNATGLDVDLISIDIQNAYDALGEITGETVGEDIMDKIFSEFCIGK